MMSKMVAQAIQIQGHETIQAADYTFPKLFRIEELIQALNELLAK